MASSMTAADVAVLRRERQAQLELKRKRLAELRGQRDRQSAADQEKEKEREAAKLQRQSVDAATQAIREAASALVAESNPNKGAKPKGKDEPSAGPSGQAASRLGVVTCAHADVKPVALVTFSKATQTPSAVVAAPRQPQPQSKRPAEEAEPEVIATPAAAAAAAAAAADGPARDPLTARETADILGSLSFNKFFGLASKRVQRLLESSEPAPAAPAVHHALRPRVALTAGQRTPPPADLSVGVSSISWSSVHPELYAAAYAPAVSGLGTCASLSLERAAPVLVWSLHMAAAPEFVLEAPSPVASLAFVEHHAALLVGGLYSGQILVWDLRADSRAAVAATALSAEGHALPVVSLTPVGPANNFALVSSSSDGRVLSWAMENLAAPAAVLRLTDPSAPTLPVRVSACCFSRGSQARFYCGSQLGAVYSARRHGERKGADRRYAHHASYVSAVDAAPAERGSDTDLVLSASFDWTVALWSSARPKPLFVFEDAVCAVTDVQWAPQQAGVFATGDGLGGLAVWDIGQSTSGAAATAAVATAGHGVSRVRWAPSGALIAVGDTAGGVAVQRVEITEDAGTGPGFESAIRSLESQAE